MLEKNNISLMIYFENLSEKNINLGFQFGKEN